MIGPRWVRIGWVAVGRGLALCGLSLLALPLAVALVLAVCTLFLPGVFLVPVTVTGICRYTNRMRRLTGGWSAMEIPSPYRPRAPLSRGAKGWWQRWSWILTDPATWRDLLWLLVSPIAGALAGLPGVVIAGGLFGIVQPTRSLNRLARSDDCSLTLAGCAGQESEPAGQAGKHHNVNPDVQALQTPEQRNGQAEDRADQREDVGGPCQSTFATRVSQLCYRGRGQTRSNERLHHRRRRDRLRNA
jgi:hypothetical protein